MSGDVDLDRRLRDVLALPRPEDGAAEDPQDLVARLARAIFDDAIAGARRGAPPDDLRWDAARALGELLRRSAPVAAGERGAEAGWELLRALPGPVCRRLEPWAAGLPDGERRLRLQLALRFAPAAEAAAARDRGGLPDEPDGPEWAGARERARRTMAGAMPARLSPEVAEFVTLLEETLAVLDLAASRLPDLAWFDPHSPAGTRLDAAAFEQLRKQVEVQVDNRLAVPAAGRDLATTLILLDRLVRGVVPGGPVGDEASSLAAVGDSWWDGRLELLERAVDAALDGGEARSFPFGRSYAQVQALTEGDVRPVRADGTARVRVVLRTLGLSGSGPSWSVKGRVLFEPTAH